MDEQWIESCLQTVEDISDMLDYNNPEHQRHIESAQSVMFTLDSTSFFDDTTRLGDQVNVIETLQRFAFIDSDTGSIDDIAAWCLQKWLRILQLRPQIIPALKGLFHVISFHVFTNSIDYFRYWKMVVVQSTTQPRTYQRRRKQFIIE